MVCWKGDSIGHLVKVSKGVIYQKSSRGSCKDMVWVVDRFEYIGSRNRNRGRFNVFKVNLITFLEKLRRKVCVSMISRSILLCCIALRYKGLGLGGIKRNMGCGRFKIKGKGWKVYSKKVRLIFVDIPIK